MDDERSLRSSPSPGADPAARSSSSSRSPDKATRGRESQKKSQRSLAPNLHVSSFRVPSAAHNPLHLAKQQDKRAARQLLWSHERQPALHDKQQERPGASGLASVVRRRRRWQGRWSRKAMLRELPSQTSAADELTSSRQSSRVS